MISVTAPQSDYLIINKPAGILVHPPHPDYQEETLVDILKKVYPEIQVVGDDTALRPGIVHRLDAGVSGVMVIARTQDFFEWIKSQFKARSVHKEYVALVYGNVKKDAGVIELPLRKTPFRSRTKVMPKGSLYAKEAVTYFEVLERFSHYTLVGIVLKTGRTHQIRAHFAHYGHSLVGDREYCHPRYRKRTAFTRHLEQYYTRLGKYKKSPISSGSGMQGSGGFTKFVKFDRVFLHQKRLGFYDRLNHYCEYTADMPDELQSFLATLSQ